MAPEHPKVLTVPTLQAQSSCPGLPGSRGLGEPPPPRCTCRSLVWAPGHAQVHLPWRDAASPLAACLADPNTTGEERHGTEHRGGAAGRRKGTPPAGAALSTRNATPGGSSGKVSATPRGPCARRRPRGPCRHAWGEGPAAATPCPLGHGNPRDRTGRHSEALLSPELTTRSGV